MDRGLEDKKPVSFGFSKKKQKQTVIEKSAIGEKHEKEVNEPDYVLELQGKEVKSAKPKEEPKELVIPLIQRNVWQKDSRREDRRKDGTRMREEQNDNKKPPDTGGDVKPGNIDDEAVKEIIKEAAKHNEEWDSRGNTDLNMSIPLLMRNKVPEGYEEDDRLDVSLRPEETTDKDYEEVPIEQFGMAMLRGMGWKQEEGIGNKMKRPVEPVDIVVRPKGQGLGADKRPVMPKKQVRRKPGDKKVEEEINGIGKGAGVLVTSGPHKNLYGKIEGTDEDNARVVIKLAISNQSVTISQYAVELVDKDEYKKNAKDLGKFSRGHDEISKRKEQKDKDDARRQDRRENGHRDSSPDHHRKRDKDDERHRKKHKDTDSGSDRKYRDDKHRDGHRGSSRQQDEDDSERRRKDHRRDRDGEDRDRRRKRDKYGDEEDRRSERDERDRRKERETEDRDDSGYDKKDKRRKVENDYREEQSPDSDSTSKQQFCWLRPELRVRFIDKEYKKGKYYYSKVVIIDVVTRDTCICKTEEGRLLEDVHQNMVETLIPKTEPGYVMVVNGDLKGQLGTILKRDKAKCRAAVQLLQDREIVKLDYDSICEYVGDIQANDDY